MRLNTLSVITLLILVSSSLGSRVRATYDDPAGDYVLSSSINPNDPSEFDPSTLTIDPNGSPHIAPDVKSVEGVYSASTSSYVFTITFWNSTIQLPFSNYSGVDTRVAGYLDLKLGSGAAPESLIDQESQFYLGTGYSPLPTSDFYLNLGASNLVPGSNYNTVKVQHTGSNSYDPSNLGTLAMPNSQTFTISVPIVALGLVQPATNLTYAFVAVSDSADAVDFAPNSGSPYSMTSVPEASSLTLISLGGVGLALGLWRGRRRAV